MSVLLFRAFFPAKGLYVAALVMMLIYFAHYEVHVMFYPTAVKTMAMVYLAALKLKFEVILPRRRARAMVLGPRDDDAVFATRAESHEGVEEQKGYDLF